MKKTITSLVLAALIITSASSTAFAASRHSTITSYSTCTVEGCSITKTHPHDGISYASHKIDDGHDYHQICTVANCTKIGIHDHNGATYFAHHNQDGHTYHISNKQHNNHNKSSRHH